MSLWKSVNETAPDIKMNPVASEKIYRSIRYEFGPNI